MAQSGQRSVMQHKFSEVPHADIQRSSFDRSHGYKTTFNEGWLVPFFVDEIYPGDTFNLKTSGFARLATPIFPIMDNMRMDTHFFFCPYRLVWENWEKFMGEQDNPGDSTDFLIPTATSSDPNGFSVNTVADFLGMPTLVPGVEVSTLYFRAHDLIWNEWFRDENLQDSRVVDKDDGPDEQHSGGGFIGTRQKRHDYFTSSLPFAQKGPDVLLPLADYAPVVSNIESGQGGGIPTFTGGQMTNTPLHAKGSATDADAAFWENAAVGDESMVWGNPSLSADLQSATATTINQLREAFAIQKMYEKDARGGTRYTEIVRAHFRVTSPDARLQRTEYLGGGSSPVNISPIHSATDSLTDVQTGRNLGDLSAVGTAAFSGHGFTKSFTEHGIVMGFVSVTSDLTYQQGLNRMFSRSQRFDFYFPSLAHLGEQEVLNKEIYAQGSLDANDDLVFGYQERFAELRYYPSKITGEFRSNSTSDSTPGGPSNTLDAWHLSIDFDTLPQLDDNFIIEKAPLERVIAVTDEVHFIADFYHKLICARPMPTYGVPGQIDRF